jgi:uncharacterized membrane protein YfcA
MLLVLAFVAVRGREQVVREPLRGAGVIVRHQTDPEGRTYVYAYKAWQGILLSVGVGFISSLFGIGGGVIHVPAMIIVLHIPVMYAVATSHFVLAFMSGGGTAVHIIDGSLSGDEAVKAVALAIGAIPGAQIGAHLSHRIKGRAVLLMLGFAIVVLGTRLLLKAALGI